MSNDQLRSAAADVVGAFESLSKTSDAAGLMVSSSRCEAAMAKLSAAMKDGHSVGMPAAPVAPVVPVAWVPYLLDRADGVADHYAIARWNPRGYREVWNLRNNCWASASDDVMCLEEADSLLRQIEIPTVRQPAAQPVATAEDSSVAGQPLTREQIESMRRDGMEPDEYPEPWAYARGVRDAERAHGIGQPAAGEGNAA